MFLLKKAIAAVLQPLPIATLLLVLGLLAFSLRRRRLARVAVLVGGILALAASLGPVANALLRPLEYRYAATLDASAVFPAPRYIAVLGSDYRPRRGLPITAELGAEAVVRITEGVRLMRQLPQAQLIVSGGAAHGEPPSAHGYAVAAQALGVPASSIIIIDTPRDTVSEIRALRARIGSAPVLLVSSAAHMPRVMAYCAREGLRGIPAPTGNLTAPGQSWGLGALMPSGTALRKTETAIHEYLGLLALTLGVG